MEAETITSDTTSYSMHGGGGGGHYPEIAKLNLKRKNRSNSLIKMPIFIRELLAEMVGTYLLVMIGLAAVANYKLNRNSKVGVDHFAVAFTFGIGGMSGIAASMPISGSHLNPAVSLAFALSGRLSIYKVPHYLLGQYIGALLASFTVFIVYYEGIQEYDHGTRIAYAGEWFHENKTMMSELASGDIFATFPAPWVSVTTALLDQIIATFALVFCVLAVTDKRAKLPEYLHPFMLGMVICGVVVAFGLQCGAALNPARDLSPRLFLLIGGYGFDAFRPVESLYWIVAGIIGPHIGAIIAAWSYGFLLWHDNNDQDHEDNEKH
ncbi:aquaporin-9 [Dermatophagoides farinae]|uniref:aquaporin-9 n=1 Tax=Dermatophagoides farinae TaxID=6954 RepID=UPI003F5F494E